MKKWKINNTNENKKKQLWKKKQCLTTYFLLNYLNIWLSMTNWVVNYSESVTIDDLTISITTKKCAESLIVRLTNFKMAAFSNFL